VTGSLITGFVSGAGTVAASDTVLQAVNKLDGNIAAINTLADGKIYLGNGSNVATEVTPSGDATISNAGVVAIGAGKVLSAMVEQGLIRYADVTIATGEVLALRTTPKTLVAAPGAGYCIVPLSAYATLDYNSIAYDNGTDTLDVQYSGGSALMSFATTLIEASADIRSYVGMAEAAFAPLDNTALVARCSSADPTAGNSAIKIRVYYRIVPLLL
jgi:hypothetical protein